MDKLKCTLLKLMIVVSAFMFAHVCSAQTSTANDTLEVLKQGREDQENSIGEMQQKLAAQEQVIISMKESLEQRSVINQLQEKLDSQEQMINSLRDSLQGLTSPKKSYSKRIETLDSKIYNAEVEKRAVAPSNLYGEERHAVAPRGLYSEEKPAVAPSSQKQTLLSGAPRGLYTEENPADAGYRDENERLRAEVARLKSSMTGTDSNTRKRWTEKTDKKYKKWRLSKYSTQQMNRRNNNASALDYGSYGAQMNRQQMNRSGFNQGNLHIGALQIHLTFHERLQYDDNVYKVSGTHRKEEGQDSITTFTRAENEGKQAEVANIASPGVRLELPLGERVMYGKVKRLGLNWQSDFKNYLDEEASQNQDNHYVVGDVTVEVFKGYDLTLKHNWQHTEVGAGSETDKVHNRDTNTFGIGLRASQLFHSLKKLDIEVAYQNFDQDYTEKALERANRNQHSFSLNIYYQLTPKITVKFPQYTYSRISYDKNREETFSSTTDPLSDSHTNTVTGGVTWKATARTTGFFNIGITSRQYEDDSHQGYDLVDAANWRTSDTTSWIMDGGITTKLPWNTLLDVTAFRNLREAEFTAKSNSYFSTGGAIKLSNQFKKLSTDYTASFFQTDFNGVNREDNIWSFAVNATHPITKWSQVEAGYSYRKKDTNSDFDREDEEINKAYLGFGLGL